MPSAPRNREEYFSLAYQHRDAHDRPWIHSIPGWHVLCDLCIEDCVLDETGE